MIQSIKDVAQAFDILRSESSPTTTLLFLHPKIGPNLSQEGIPIISSAPFSQLIHDQLNNRWEFSTVAEHLHSCKPSYKLGDSDDVLNVITRVMHLTRGKLLQQPDWDEW
jgi:hypothetical protein